ncbi:MAG TPA: hypothetical protein PLZ45_11075 [Ferruginibacter sp.]|nr:hypothetical protein [Ferruginibacter sp.]
MKKIILLVLLVSAVRFTSAQNVGIGTATPANKLHVVGITRSDTVALGTSTPRSPLSFAPLTGEKITLWDDGNAGGNNYGIGVQGALLQFHSYTAGDNIAFGFGKSAAMTERMRIINSGGDGMILSGRVYLKNGTNPLDLNYGSGVWLYKPDNSALLGFMGVQNSQNVGFYGGPNGWGFTYDAINSRVGINNNNPNAPLAFAAALGKKITLYPGGTGDVGFGVAGNRLQIYSDNPGADVAIGYDAAGTFNERFAFKPNGALAVNGSMGSPGQVLKTNGSGGALAWVGRPYAMSFTQTANTSNFPAGDLTVAIPGLDNQSFSISETSNVVFNANIMVYDASAIGTSYVYTEVQFLNISAQVVGTARAYGEVAPFRKNNINVTGMATLTPGFYTTRVVLGKDAGGDAPAATRSEGDGKLILEIFPN